MTEFIQKRSIREAPALVACVLASLLVFVDSGLAAKVDQLERDEQKFTVTIDATAIVSQSWWHVPGVTPSIWTSDPETSDAYRTTETRVLQLKPAPYKFTRFTLAFPFEVTPAGTVTWTC